mgnify:CR=1 FL=1
MPRKKKIDPKSITEIDGIPIDEYQVNMKSVPKEKLIELYQIEKKSVKQIARKFKCSYRTVYRRLHRFGIPLNEREYPKKKPKQYLGKKQLSALMEKDLTIPEIANKLRTTPDIVRRYIFKYRL